MSSPHIQTGKIGESAACEYLQKKGYGIIETHSTSHWAEIDIVAKKGDQIVFVEVKTRTSDRQGKPYESVNRRKIHHLKRAIDMYLLKNKLQRYKLSLDVIAVMLNPDASVQSIRHYQNISLENTYV